jgi:hypothetical protein
MSSVYEDYDDMPNLEQVSSTQQQAATSVPQPTTADEVSHETTSAHGDYDDMPDLEQAPSMQQEAAAPNLPWPPTGSPANIYAGAGLNQEILSTFPISVFTTLAQALSALGPPPGFDASDLTPYDPASTTGPEDLLTVLAAMFSTLHGGHDDTEDDDAWEDESGDEHDDVPSLETTIPPTAHPPFALLHIGPDGPSQPVAPPGSFPSTPMASAEPQNGSGSGPDASAATASDQNHQNGPGNDQPSLFTPFPTPYSFIVGPPPAIGPDGIPVDAAGVPYNTLTAASIEELVASLQAVGISSPTAAAITSIFSQMPPNVFPPFSPPMDWPPFSSSRRPRFDASAFVDTLEEVDIATIPAEDMRCPHCWLPFGTTDEDDPAFVFVPDPDDPPELAARQVAFSELPFCAARPDNNPVRTPCGHLFGRSCLIETLEKVDTLCPTCRKELRPKPQVPGVLE